MAGRLQLGGECELEPPAEAAFGRQRRGRVLGLELVKMGRRFVGYAHIEWIDVDPPGPDFLRTVHLRPRAPAAPARARRRSPAWLGSHQNAEALGQLRLKLGGG